ncbi:MAG: deoxyribodipyrimidine photo-lyase [Legionella sp.]|nr:MAG: deoxyribodipyrimidine photo-lyase [Legionella sp.]
MSTALFWFRQDLRSQDNPALAQACANHQKIIPVYINDPMPPLAMGAAQKWWLYHSLCALKKDLIQVGLDLFFKKGKPLLVLQELIATEQIDAIYWNRCYEPMHIARDQQIKTELKALGVDVISCNGLLLHEPWEVLNQSKEYFKVFTPYWRQAVRQMQIRPLMQITDWPKLQKISTDDLHNWQLTPTKPNWASEFSQHWQPGEIGAIEKLDQFIHTALQDYQEARNEPGKLGTSKLSPHLHFGEISPQYIWTAVHEAMQDPRCNQQSAQVFLAELGWREFSYQLLYHYPQLPDSNFKRQFDHFPWQEDEKAIERWQKGLTGFPIVDAGMRELWHTGYMHNRVRMIVASFLTKDLLIDWRKGAAWFWDTLLDADLANNSASWQWVAGSGADASPYYRVFNPVLQGEKFDVQGEYTKRWVPELAQVPLQWLHKPWEAPKGTLPIELGKDYPLPMVDHAAARLTALAYYKNLADEKKHHKDQTENDD